MTRLEDPLGTLPGRAVRAAGWLALAWAVVVGVEIVVSVSDLYATPLGRLPASLVVDTVLGSAQGGLAALQLVLALAVAAGCARVRSTGASAVVLGVAVLALLPPVLTGHSATSSNHDVATLGLLLHVLAVVIWTGGLVALWWHLTAAPERRAIAARRFSSLAAWCFAATALTGAATALARLDSPAALVTSGYGAGVVAKVVVLALVGLVAIRVRRAARGASGQRRDLGLLTGVELVVLFVAIGLGVALARTPSPGEGAHGTVAEVLLGGPLPPAPDLSRLLLGGQVSGVGLVVVTLGAALYVAGILALRRRGDHWPVGRTLSWAAGLLVVAYATCGGLGVYSHVMFSAHMASHMLLSMVAPIFLVLGAPVGLALRALPGSDEVGGTGPRQLLAGLLRARPVRVLTHPLVAAGLFVASLYGVYLTGLFDVLMSAHLGHMLMELHFLLTGFVFYEVLVGSAPIRRPPYFGRVAMLLLTMPQHAFFAVTVMGSATVIGADYYERLDRGYATDLLADQNLGGSMTWALGEVPMVILLVVLVAQWFRQDRRDAARYDRRADRDDDAELAAYNARLQRLSAAGSDAARRSSSHRDVE